MTRFWFRNSEARWPGTRNFSNTVWTRELLLLLLLLFIDMKRKQWFFPLSNPVVKPTYHEHFFYSFLFENMKQFWCNPSSTTTVKTLPLGFENYHSTDCVNSGDIIFFMFRFARVAGKLGFSTANRSKKIMFGLHLDCWSSGRVTTWKPECDNFAIIIVIRRLEKNRQTCKNCLCGNR